MNNGHINFFSVLKQFLLLETAETLKSFSKVKWSEVLHICIINMIIWKYMNITSKSENDFQDYQIISYHNKLKTYLYPDKFSLPGCCYTVQLTNFSIGYSHPANFTGTRCRMKIICDRYNRMIVNLRLIPKIATIFEIRLVNQF